MPPYNAKQIESMNQAYLEVLNSLKQGEILIKEWGIRVAKITGVSEKITIEHVSALNHGYGSKSEERNALAQGHGHDTHRSYQKKIIGEKFGIPLPNYELNNAEKREKRPENQLISALIIVWLDDPNNNRDLLANKLEITAAATTKYANGTATPRKNLQPKFFETLGLPYKTIDEIFKSPYIADALIDDILDHYSNRSSDSLIAPIWVTDEKLKMMEVVYGEAMLYGLEMSRDDMADLIVFENELPLHVAFNWVLARENGFDSYKEFKANKFSHRKQRPENQIIKALMNEWLSLPKNNVELFADRTNISDDTVYDYRLGLYLPRKEYQPKFFEELGLPYRSLEEILEIPHNTTDELINTLLEQLRYVSIV